MTFPRILIEVPAWVDDLELSGTYPRLEDRMQLVIELSRLNLEHRTGGPFGAAIFEIDSGRLVAPGMNLVVPSSCSVAHAEMVALMIAQQVVACFDLGGPGMPARELVTSTEPCAMCFGAIPWSGVRRVVCGARDEDARRIGFDEGPKMSDWVAALEQRGISVTRDVCRDSARAILQQYGTEGGVIYNSRGGPVP
jgi:tRNA(Arg) A34 adenosine deaminase TadA